MKIGLQIPRFDWPGGPADIAPQLAQIARTADEAGFSSLWVMDHLLQISSIGKVDEPMLESYTTLAFLAGQTQRIELGTMVTAAGYRSPGLLIKQVSTLDVVSGGRAWLGIGAGWYEREARGLGLNFPVLKRRFEQLEETLKIARQMFDGDRQPIYGKHFHLAEPLNSPLPLHRPRILIGGGGEKKTLRLVARYADACNLFARVPIGDLAWKLEVLRQHCESEGRDYDTLEKTALAQLNPMRSSPQAILAKLSELARIGFQTVIASFAQVETLQPLELMARDVLPRAAEL
jgi:F420-dependent oxidoreductase-like protein